MTRKTNARDNAIAAAVRLFRRQGYTATGLTEILEESGAPKGSFYFHFPRGKTQLAEEAIDHYIAQRMAVIRQASDATAGDPLRFSQRLFDTFAADMKASDFQYGCLMQNLANELPAFESELAQRVARGFAETTALITAHFKACGQDTAQASSAAAALVASLEGARTIARVERSDAIFEALSKMAVRQWGAEARQP